jgi:hypothetical protein
VDSGQPHPAMSERTETDLGGHGSENESAKSEKSLVYEDSRPDSDNDPMMCNEQIGQIDQ